LAFAEYGGLRGGVETIDTNVSEAAPRRLSGSCGLFLNHWGSLHEAHDFNSSCDCEKMCDKTLSCRAWTQNYVFKKCYLRKSYGNPKLNKFGWTSHASSGALSGEVRTCGGQNALVLGHSRYRNHYGTLLDTIVDIDRSCDCEKKCDADTACKAWTHDGATTCYLRKKGEGQSYTLAHHVYGMTSGEKDKAYQLPPSGDCVKITSQHYCGAGRACWICDDYPTSCEPVAKCNRQDFWVFKNKRELKPLSCYQCS